MINRINAVSLRPMTMKVQDGSNSPISEVKKPSFVEQKQQQVSFEGVYRFVTDSASKAGHLASELLSKKAGFVHQADNEVRLLTGQDELDFEKISEALGRTLRDKFSYLRAMGDLNGHFVSKEVVISSVAQKGKRN